MKLLVLDATELVRDWLCSGMKYALLQQLSDRNVVRASVPASVLEEVVARYTAECERVGQELEKQNLRRRRLGLPQITEPRTTFNYRDHLIEQFDEVLGIDVLPWPTVQHEHLVLRAAHRIPPFNAGGSGYRDALVWHSTLEAAASGADVVLVSADGAFADKNDSLVGPLLLEASNAGLRIELVRDLTPWLLDQVPWTAEDLNGAVAIGRTEDFLKYFLESDMQDALWPNSSSLGLRSRPSRLEIESATWDGGFQLVRSSTEGNATVAEYDIGQIVEFRASVPADCPMESGWSAVEQFGELVVEAEVAMVVRVAVLYGDDHRWSMESLDWRRADGSPLGYGLLAESDETAVRLF